MSVILDTSVLVYLYDDSAPLKQVQARRTLHTLAEAGAGAVSTQVLSEFFHVVTRRLRFQMTLESALIELERHARVWRILNVTAPVIIAAAHAVGSHKLSFWDAQIWAVARLNHVDAIFSEGFNAGSSRGGVHFVNPFAAGFRLEDWLN